MRKFVFNTSVIGAVVGVFPIVQATRKGQRDWRLALLWLGWALTVAVAVGTVAKDSRALDVDE